MGRRKFIPSLVHFQVRKTFIPANVLYVYLTIRSTHTWANFGPIFLSIGRQGDWDATLGLGNPAISLPVKEYLKSVTAEQLQARVTPKQATPLFLDKLFLLSRHLDRKMSSPSVTPTNLFILARDQAVFKSLFFSADRGNDLGLVQTQEIRPAPWWSFTCPGISR